jgi:hypothetical protein
MLAVVDRIPRSYTRDELKLLGQLSVEVMEELEFRISLKTKSTVPVLNKRLKALHKRVEQLRF